MKRTFTRFSAVLAALLIAATGWAQQQTPLDIALRHLEQKREAWGLADGDTKDVVLRDQVYSRHNGTTHFYFNQRHEGIEVYNAINGVHVQEGKVVFSTNRFTPNLAEKVNTTAPSLTAYQAIEAAATDLGLIMDGREHQIAQDGHVYTFSGGSISDSDIKVELVYQMMEDGSARLAWDLAIDMPTTHDYWSLRMDAITGEELDRINWNVSCNFDAPNGTHAHSHNCEHTQAADKPGLPIRQALEQQNMVQSDNAVYNVFALPAESPIHGPRVLVENPADTLASPFGWHDTNGEAGPEYTITRGNNVHAYLDLDNSNQPQGDEPDGGENLVFDFPIDLNAEPETYQEAAVTQLFYTNNMIHDIVYAYGFDEQAGNFQQNNYGRGGQGSDYVNAHAQDGGGVNNANFATPPDGGNGTMQMYLWQGGGSIFSVNSPQPVAGSYEVREANFGAPITENPVVGDVIIADDGTSEGSLACNPLENVEAMEGKIAIIDRGGCEFGLKSLNAQEAGAIGVIICNFENVANGMDPGAVGGQVTIPVVSLGNADCQAIREFAGQGLNVTFQVPDDSGPEFVDGDLDNGIVAHEYGHGISNRLTGGPSAAGCLGNDEQMGEGWSDYFALITSVQPGETGDMPRGIGTFALKQETNGSGIRRQRYSTDFSVNNQTYDDVKGTTAPHPLGEVWAVVTWDLYWAFVEEYGWDPDPINGTGGNNMAIQLVMDGMKLQACSPGFEDGRDAIFAADVLNYDGIHECLIWEVFARRGMGYFMTQEDSNNRNDNVEDFEPRPECIRELKITKSVTPLIEAGEEIEVTMTLTNHKGETVTGVMVEDEIPTGLSFIPGSAEGADATATGSAVTLEVGDMSNGEVVTISYKLASDEEIFSTTQYFDGMENDDENWFFLNLDPEGFNVWEISELDAYEGEKSWFIENTEFVNDQVIFLQEPVTVTGENPVLRFFHKFNTVIGFDGGVVEISTDGGFTWQRIPERLIRNGYNSTLDYQTLVIPFLEAFSGDSQGWIDTYIDLSDYAGQDINFRFRFGSNEGGVPTTGTNPGWFVDNVEIMDMISYNGEACVMSNEGDMACTIAPEEGTIVESGLASSVEEALPEGAVKVFPNPANDLLNVAIDVTGAEEALITLVAMDGRVMQEQQVEMGGFYQLVPVNVAQLPAGMYFVKVQAGSKMTTQKVVIR
jgi:uncharacterized repeat protein (TIGR01451 family)